MKGSRIGLGESFGVVSLIFATKDIRFPVEKEELVRRLAVTKLYWDRDTVIDLKEVLRSSDKELFSSMCDVLCAVANHESVKT
ncbi:MAG: hypothetical protein HYS81_01760 [Candidatus Aenigmatarchaeota archaeon]|nr:MAG: hypothetical protein HYS81_01760 [Candidatus Aenigmarchaeota archaeon]